MADTTSSGLDVWWHEDALDHRPQHGARQVHPERPERAAAVHKAVRDSLGSAPADPPVRWHSPDLAPWDQLAWVHRDAYLQTLRSADGCAIQLDEDTGTSPGSIVAARRAAGACLEAGRHCARTPGARALCLTRPPGHHALPERAMGFCLLANLALGIEAARRHGNPQSIQRVAVLDWDVHLGNGTMEIFDSDPEVLVVDVHEAELWPHLGDPDHRGRGLGLGSAAQVPLPGGSGDAEHLAATREIFAPLVRRHDPELICIAAGFDAHTDDPLGGQCMTTSGFAALMTEVCALANEVPHRRVMVTLEGGYHVPALADAASVCAQILAGHTPRCESAHTSSPRTQFPVSPTARAALDRARGLHHISPQVGRAPCRSENSPHDVREN